MIYLIDDKKLRQESYSWTAEKIAQYKQALITIYSKTEFDKIRETLLASDDIILFHDSFFDNPDNYEQHPAPGRQALLDRARKAPVVFFGGATSSRTIDKKYVSIPVSVLYNNLSPFLNKYIEDGLNNNIELRNLVFGKNYELEEIVIKKEEIWNLLYDIPTQSQMTFNPEINSKLDDIFIRLHKKGERSKYFPHAITVEVFKHQLSKIIKDHING